MKEKEGKKKKATKKDKKITHNTTKRDQQKGTGTFSSFITLFNF
jgi:hypothetical protein